MAELIRAIFGELLRHVVGDRIIWAIMGLALAAWFGHSGWIEFERRRFAYATILLPLAAIIAFATCFLACSN